MKYIFQFYCKKVLLLNNYIKGFTLIELLVVVSIIGLLSSVVLVSLNAARSRGKDTNRAFQVTQLITAYEFYYSKHGNYTCTGYWVTYGDADFLKPLIDEGFLPSLFNDPGGTAEKFRIYTFRDVAGGPCGQNLFISFSTQKPIRSCPSGGKLYNGNHCHVMYPAPMKCQGGSWWNDGPGSMPADCAALLN